ncbi:MAG: PIN domain-containing protein [Cocleimonas sp.]
MSDKVFFDTNVLVYAFDKSEPEKGAIAKRLIREYGSEGNLVLSTQVLQEFYVTVTKVKKKMLTKEKAEEIVNDFAEFPLIQAGKAIVSRAMKRHQGGAFSFWDALIVEAALQSGCSKLLTEDMQDGLIIDSMVISNPFKL